MGGSGSSIRLGSFVGLLGLTVLLAVLLAPVGAALPDGAGAGKDARVPGHYIVVLRDSIDRPGAVARAQVDAHGGDVGFVYRYALKGYSATLSKEAVDALREDPRVNLVSPDH